MTTNTDSDTLNFSDILLQEQPESLVTYHSGTVVYEESLTAGALVGRGWNGDGLVNFHDGRLPAGTTAFTAPAGWCFTVESGNNAPMTPSLIESRRYGVIHIRENQR